MYFFHNDYNALCHESVLKRLTEIRDVPMDSYGMDTCNLQAADRIRKLCEDETLSVHFIPGGTQANVTVIASALRPFQAVIAAVNAHIHAHETGALEGTGHKILALPAENGKISAEQVRKVVEDHWSDESHEHIAQPKMVYLSNPTELGTLYSHEELQEMAQVCREYGLFLFVDGARMGYGLMAEENDITLPDYARLTDVFYIGGTKQGTMLGEAVVIPNPVIAKDFRYMIKRQCGMLAKGWILGAQFDALLEGDTYFRIAAHANAMADILRETLKKQGYPLLVPGCTNQVFPILPDSLLERLKENFTFTEQERVDATHRAVRFCTSWATTRESVEALCRELEQPV